MKDFSATQKRYMRDPLPIRLGGLAADLARISTAAANPRNLRVVEVLLEEARRFIEWTAGEAEPFAAGQLVDIQIALTLWLRALPAAFSHATQRALLAHQAACFSNTVLAMSGLAAESPTAH